MISCELLKTLSDLRGVSGYEEAISPKIASMFVKYCDSVSVDKLGNIIGIKKSDNNDSKKVMIEAHMDEIGLMITNIDKDGFLYFTSVGGIDARILLANEVVVHGKRDIYGVIGAKPPHVLTSKEKDATVPMDKLYIDTGFSKDEISQIVSVGDTATFANNFTELKNGCVSTKSQDDRSCVAILFDLMQRLSNVPLPFDVYFVAAVQEEVGLRGARTAAHSINPDLGIVIDVCHATTPDASKDVFAFSSGAIITKGPNIFPTAVKKLTQILDDNSIKYQIDIEGGNTGTDAWAIQVVRCGVPTVLFSIPLRYMHTPVETVSTSDLDTTADAIYAFLTNINGTEECTCI